MMLKRILDLSVSFIKVIGSLVSGFTALFYAMGFLAWNSRMLYLGMSESEIVNINYLITGANFFISLPLRLLAGFKFLHWGLLLIPAIAFICICLGIIRNHKKRYSKFAFLITGIVLLAFLLWALGWLFFEYLSGPSEPGVLFSKNKPTSKELQKNYSMLVSLTIFAITLTVLMFSWQGRIERAMESPKEEATKLPDEPKNKDTVKQEDSSLSRMKSSFADITPWKVVVSLIPLLIGFIVLLYILLLPMNFIHPVVSERHPVINISFKEKEIYNDIQPDSDLFLLKNEKERLLLYSRKFMKIYQIKQEDVKEFTIVEHRDFWD